MSDFKADGQEDPKAAKPGQPVSPSTVLDSIFRKDGPMPPAGFGIRIIAFLLDFILLTAFASVIIWKFAMPAQYPGAFSELQTWSETLVHSLSATDRTTAFNVPELSPFLQEALAYGRDIQLMIFWLYFALGEALFKGRTLGKHACKLRSISTVTLAPPTIVVGIVRGGMKTIALFLIFPLGLLINLGALFFNKRKQMGHDLFSRTIVIDEKSVNVSNK